MSRSIIKIFEIILCLIVIDAIIYAQYKGGRWQFEKNGDDSAGWDSKNNIGLISGSGSYNSLQPLCEGNSYLALDDSINYSVFLVPDDDELDFKDEDFALSMWICPKPSVLNPQFLLIKGDRSGSSKNNNYALRLNNGYFEFMVHSESGGQKSVTSSFAADLDKWNFIAVFFSNSIKKIFLWHDSHTQPDTFDFDVRFFPNNDMLHIGTAGANGFKRFYGRIDDVRISDRIENILSDLTDVESSHNNNFIHSFSLFQNYPNPFNSQTTIKFKLEEGAFTKISVFNSLLQEIHIIVQAYYQPGTYAESFDAAKFSSGVYFYKVLSGSYSQIKKMILIK